MYKLNLRDLLNVLHTWLYADEFLTMRIHGTEINIFVNFLVHGKISNRGSVLEFKLDNEGFFFFDNEDDILAVFTETGYFAPPFEHERLKTLYKKLICKLGVKNGSR